MQLSQNAETMSDLRNFLELEQVLQLFFSSECEMQKLQKKTHNISSKMRNNASFQLYAPEDDKTGNMSTLLEPADSYAVLAKKCVLMPLTNHSFTWDKNAFPLCCLSGFLTPFTGKFYLKLLALEDMRCLGLESTLGSFFAAERCGTSGLDRLRGGAYILTEGQSLFVPYGFFPVIISLLSKENVDKGAFLHKVHYSDSNRHMLHKLDKQAISLYFASALPNRSCRRRGWNQDKDGRVILQLVETGYTPKVFERKRQTLVWTSAPCTLHRFQLRYHMQHEVFGFHSLCFSCNVVPAAVPGFMPRSALFLSTR